MNSMKTVLIIAVLGVGLLFLVAGYFLSSMNTNNGSELSSQRSEHCLKYDDDMKKLLALRGSVIARRVEMAMIQNNAPPELIQLILERSETREYTPAIIQEFGDMLGETLNDLFIAAGCGDNDKEG